MKDSVENYLKRNGVGFDKSDYSSWIGKYGGATIVDAALVVIVNKKLDKPNSSDQAKLDENSIIPITSEDIAEHFGY